MSTLLARLPHRARRGSKPRCHGLTHGEPVDVAARLTKLIAPFGAVSPQDRWMPEGFEQIEEAELHKALRLLGEDHCAQVKRWWFAIFTGGRQTGPSFDIASTCTVTVANKSAPGIMLVEAKAYDEELNKGEAGKPIDELPSKGKQTNHDRIGTAILEANRSLMTSTGLNCSLSRDSHYQMSNRFATACKLTELGYSVILVYLGFLKAEEMEDKGKVFQTAAEGNALVKSHSEPLFPVTVWNAEWKLNGQSFVPLIRSVNWPLVPGASA